MSINDKARLMAKLLAGYDDDHLERLVDDVGKELRVDTGSLDQHYVNAAMDVVMQWLAERLAAEGFIAAFSNVPNSALPGEGFRGKYYGG